MGCTIEPCVVFDRDPICQEAGIYVWRMKSRLWCKMLVRRLASRSAGDLPATIGPEPVANGALGECPAPSPYWRAVMRWGNHLGRDAVRQ
jgi:hypothetical protein